MLFPEETGIWLFVGNPGVLDKENGTVEDVGSIVEVADLLGRLCDDICCMCIEVDGNFGVDDVDVINWVNGKDDIDVVGCINVEEDENK